MSTPTTDDAAKVFADPQSYTDEVALHAALTHLRANAPVSLVDVPNYRPFWAITRHADIMDIERNNALFTNWPRPVLTTTDGDELQVVAGVKTLIHRRGLVPAESHAGVEGSSRRACEELRRQDAGGRSGVRLRARGRGELPAVRDHVAAGNSGVGLLADAEAHPGAVRQ